MIHLIERDRLSNMHTGNACTAVANLQAATAVLLKLDLAELPDPALLDAVRQLRPVVCQVQAAEARLIGAVHLRGAVTAEGGVSTAAWLRNGVRIHDASARVGAAVVLDRLPRVAAAFAAGEISEAHVAVITKVARDICDEAMAAGAEDLLVEQARQLAPTKFGQAATRIRDHLDPEAAQRRRRHRLADRWLYTSRTFEGAVSINGMLDPESGETLLTALAALMPPPRAGDLRTAPTRRADALLDLCRLAANASPVAGGEKPHVVVTVDLDTLRSQLNHPQLNGARLNRPQLNNAQLDDPQLNDPQADEQATNQILTSLLNEPAGSGPPQTKPDEEAGGGGAPLGSGATLGSGWPIGPETARRLACDAGIIPLLVGSNSEPLDVGRLNRSAPPALRRALVYRDGGCRFPQCDRPPEWTDAHHIQHWVLHGPTALRNMTLLCRAHHVMVHEQGWLISLDPTTGIVTVHYPDGRLFQTSNPRGALPLRGSPPGTTHRKQFDC